MKYEVTCNEKEVHFARTYYNHGSFISALNVFAESHNIDLTKEYFYNKDPAFYYYKCKQGLLGGNCWVSTEVSVPTNGKGFAYAQVHNNLKNSSETWEKKDGWIKTPAAKINKAAATFTEHTGDQWVGINEEHRNYKYYQK